jgi:hypothetical protein
MFFMCVIATVLVFVFVFRREVDIELDAGDTLSFLLTDVQMKTGELELFLFARELVRVHAKVQERANKHVTADAAEDVEVKSFHIACLRS